MFYSQFILAKKGPLGTIWIAAHLERKLRKNQVADTDIGVSVDSILSPDVPIALRLSSHLLLGVARIYSRKVNYLFDDCSETLLNVKQAFRSAAVDLPPEESKAPYHSITLPETFDLDDFELPDKDIFEGNFVDHHISSRDQITLQDNVEGAGYSTSKFGLDERFGDGDASGLDLDEDLFLDKIGTARHANESSDPQASVGTTATLKQDEHPETTAVDLETRVDGDDDDYGDPMDYAHAPSTPGLVEEPNLLSNAQQEVSDHLETECPLVDPTMTENAKNNTYGDKQEVDWCSHDNNSNSDAVPIEADMERVSVDEPSLVSKPTSDLSLNPGLESVDKIDKLSDFDKPNDGHQGPDEMVLAKDQGLIDASYLASKDQGGLLNLNVGEKVESAENLFFRPCNSNMGKPEISTEVDVQSDVAALENSGREEAVMLGEACCVSDNSEGSFKENHVQEHASQEDVHAISSQPDNQLHNANSHDELVKNLNNSTETELPVVEKLLSVPEGHVDLNCGAFLGLDEGDAGSKIVSDKKRSFTESTLTEQSLNSVESLRLLNGFSDLMRNISSVGRSSVLKVKPTPRLSKVTSMKRTRSAPRTGAPKRKVLMDEMMVLHGDMIRQQLTNTEDTRRVRKKAPCTITDISMIQKQYLEDEIFLQPIFTGMSRELVSLHSQTCDLSGITVVKNDLNVASLEHVAETRLPSENNENAIETMPKPILPSHEVKNDHSLETASEPHVTSQNDDTKEADEINEEINISREQTEPIADVELSLDVTGAQASEKNDYAVNSSDITGLEPLYSFGDANTCASADQSDFLPDQKTDIPSVELDSAVMDVDISQNEITTVNDGYINAEVENEPEARGDDFLPETEERIEHGEIHSVVSEDGFMNNGENNRDETEVYERYTMDAEISGFDLHDREELNYSAAGNDTEFLNVDDDELNEIGDDHIPDDDDEEERFIENTGWSSRTRAVSKYLQALFVKEADFGNESLSMDKLLIGKSRKEASRMFFEALVLKTRDYIHVEQCDPFDDVTLKPRTRLMKSDF
ncbi:sister chromatid cohesion 1 protein 4 [Phtheirospermum japonicum]|uniref:Sister chromatid cohesion 1 protein 4 n=1 Tax=Phtheirospermum japonicum TaxID=374723 RepID=A0A830C1R9_9LAMI|nr:sister chromatid cohesion 1 protein 4 [Phtheirospermum japonicum]